MAGFQGSSFSLKNSGFDGQGVHADRQDMCFCTSSETVCANTQLRWKEQGYEVVSLPLLPNATREEAASAGEAAAIHDPNLIVLDCISYTNETKRIIRETAGVPVILGISSAIRCALEMVE